MAVGTGYDQARLEVFGESGKNSSILISAAFDTGLGGNILRLKPFDYILHVSVGFGHRIGLSNFDNGDLSCHPKQRQGILDSAP
jgi:hypothetical protein